MGQICTAEIEERTGCSQRPVTLANDSARWLSKLGSRCLQLFTACASLGIEMYAQCRCWATENQDYKCTKEKTSLSFTIAISVGNK